jgi:hypothetical protein
MVKVLFLSANPPGTSRIDAAAEQRTIRECLLGSDLELDAIPAARLWDLPDTLLGDRPAIVHFSGHGLDGAASEERSRRPRGALGPGATEGAAILMHGDDGAAAPIGTDLLNSIFGVWGGTRCVVLNACYTDAHAALVEHVDCVIGTTAAIADGDAIAFSKGFYSALARGSSLGAAFAAGRIAIAGIAMGDPGIVTMIHRDGVKPDAIRLTAGTRRPPPSSSLPLSALILVAFIAACVWVALSARP